MVIDWTQKMQGTVYILENQNWNFKLTSREEVSSKLRRYEATENTEVFHV